MAVDKFILLSLIKEVIYQENQGCVVNCSECEFIEWCTKLESFLKRLNGTDLNRKKLLKKHLDMAYHNLLCMSQNYAMTKANEGQEKEWEEARKEVELIREMISDY